MKRLAMLVLACTALALPARSEEEAPPPAAGEIPAGDYALDKSHATLVFRLSHLGFSLYTAEFRDFDASLTFDPADPAAAAVEATVDAASLDLPHPPEGFADTIKGPEWLDTAQYPEITFRSTAVEPTGGNDARITGDLTLHGVTRPVTLDATFNGGWAGHPMDPHARIGFSATGTFSRSDFGVSYGVPAPGSSMGVGDTVEVTIQAEFTGPPLAPAPATP
ncbi:MAG: polyisoprenoid-binding protein [Alphaproteobacteria bacterium]|nr:polyisoprenoid-binding protein [Alphaproteobacteria bacterium]